MRLDKYLAEHYGSRTRAAAAIERGAVLVNGKTANSSYEVKEDDAVEVLTEAINFVSAGGFKLNKALSDFGFDVNGKIFADIGASTGGFTDCLLKHGAKKVYCIDVGESQLDESLKNNNVVIIDNFNARNLNRQIFKEDLDGIVIDVSFISLTYILKQVCEVLCQTKHVIALIKPQFECENRKVGKNGILKDRAKHAEIVKKIYDFAMSCGLSPKNLTDAPQVKGKNKEYLILLEKGGENVPFERLIKKISL